MGEQKRVVSASESAGFDNPPQGSSLSRRDVDPVTQAAIFQARDEIRALTPGSVGLSRLPNGLYAAEWDAPPDAPHPVVRIVSEYYELPLAAMHALRDMVKERVAPSMSDQGDTTDTTYARRLAEFEQQFRSGGYVPTTPLGPPPQGEPLFATPDACQHRWRSAGFDPNGRGLHLYCTCCGVVMIPAVLTEASAPAKADATSEDAPDDSAIAFLIQFNSLCYDGHAFFRPTRGNLISGDASRLTEHALRAGVAWLRDTATETARFLIVPPQLRFSATEILSRVEGLDVRLYVCVALTHPTMWAVTAAPLSTDLTRPDRWIRFNGQ